MSCMTTRTLPRRIGLEEGVLMRESRSIHFISNFIIF